MKLDLTTKENAYLHVFHHQQPHIRENHLYRYFRGFEEEIRDTLTSLCKKGYLERTYHGWELSGRNLKW